MNSDCAGSNSSLFHPVEGDQDVTCNKLRSERWSLDDNTKFLTVMKNLGDELIFKSKQIYNKLDELDHESTIDLARVKNIINEFQFLADSQFIENRVREEESDVFIDEASKNEEASPTKAKESTDQRILSVIKECLKSNLDFIDANFDFPDRGASTQSNESDEDEDMIGEALAKALHDNEFSKNPLPAIVGSQEFYAESFSKLDDKQSPMHNISSEAKCDQELLSDEVQSEQSNDAESNGDLFEVEKNGLVNQSDEFPFIPPNNSLPVISDLQVGSINREVTCGDPEIKPLDEDSDDENDELFKSSCDKRTGSTKLFSKSLADQLENRLALKKNANINNSLSKSIFQSDDEDEGLFVFVKREEDKSSPKLPKSDGQAPNEKKTLLKPPISSKPEMTRKSLENPSMGVPEDKNSPINPVVSSFPTFKKSFLDESDSDDDLFRAPKPKLKPRPLLTKIVSNKDYIEEKVDDKSLDNKASKNSPPNSISIESNTINSISVEKNSIEDTSSIDKTLSEHTTITKNSVAVDLVCENSTTSTLKPSFISHDGPKPEYKKKSSIFSGKIFDSDSESDEPDFFAVAPKKLANSANSFPRILVDQLESRLGVKKNIDIDESKAKNNVFDSDDDDDCPLFFSKPSDEKLASKVFSHNIQAPEEKKPLPIPAARKKPQHISPAVEQPSESVKNQIGSIARGMLNLPSFNSSKKILDDDMSSSDDDLFRVSTIKKESANIGNLAGKSSSSQPLPEPKTKVASVKQSTSILSKNIFDSEDSDEDLFVTSKEKK